MPVFGGDMSGSGDLLQPSLPSLQGKAGDMINIHNHVAYFPGKVKLQMPTKPTEVVKEMNVWADKVHARRTFLKIGRRSSSDHAVARLNGPDPVSNVMKRPTALADTFFFTSCVGNLCKCMV